MVGLKNCDADLSYILDELFNMYLKEYCFPDCWTVSLVVHVCKNTQKRSTAKHYRPVIFLSLAYKVFENLVNNRAADQLEISFS